MNVEQEIVDHAVAVISHQGKRLEFWRKYKDIFQPILDELPQDAIQSIGPTTYSLDIYITGNKDTFLAAWKVLRRAGYDHTKEVEEKFTTWNGFFRHDSEDNEAYPNIWLSFASTVCKRVQVGTEMKEVPVYEVRCDG